MPPDNDDNENEKGDNLERLSEIFDKISADKTKDEKDLQIENLCGKVEEVLSTYMIIGYTVDGDPVTVTYAKTKKDSDALAHLFNKQIANSYYGTSGNSDSI
jgi:hypothetical protein|tara:strand:+ start:1551 stop:1856 length:306 start_codon:yes stop_codon:yes gene_type:complete